MILNLTSFPRSGNSFFTTTLLAFDQHWFHKESQTYVDFQPVKLFTDEHKAYGLPKPQYLYPQEMDPAPVERIDDKENVYFYKRHDNPDNYVGPRIYLYRDGRDVLVSYAHHNCVHSRAMKNIANGQKADATIKVPEEDFLAELDRLVRGSLWSSFVAHGLNHSLVKATVKYEDLKKDAVGTVADALDKCGYEVEQVNEPPTFEALNKQYPWFYRNGQTGSYKDVMPRRLIKLFNHLHGDALKKLGYEL